jgi:hypothetical protein
MYVHSKRLAKKMTRGRFRKHISQRACDFQSSTKSHASRTKKHVRTTVPQYRSNHYRRFRRRMQSVSCVDDYTNPRFMHPFAVSCDKAFDSNFTHLQVPNATCDICCSWISSCARQSATNTSTTTLPICNTSNVCSSSSSTNILFTKNREHQRSILAQHTRAEFLQTMWRRLLWREYQSRRNTLGSSSIFISKESQDYIDLPIPTAPDIGFVVHHVITGEVMYSAKCNEAQMTIVQMIDDVKTFIAQSEKCALLHPSSYMDMRYFIDNIQAIITSHKIVLLCRIVRYNTAHDLSTADTFVPSYQYVRGTQSDGATDDICINGLTCGTTSTVRPESDLNAAVTCVHFKCGGDELVTSPRDRTELSEYHAYSGQCSADIDTVSALSLNYTGAHAEKPIQAIPVALYTYDDDDYTNTPPPNMTIACEPRATQRWISYLQNVSD